MPVLQKFIRRKIKHEVRYPLRTAFRGAVRQDNGRLTKRVMDLEKFGLLIGWSPSMCLAYAVQKRSFKVANMLIRRFKDKSVLVMGARDGNHYYTYILELMACRGDIEGFKWLMTKVKPADFQEDVITDAYDACKGRRGKEFAAQMIKTFDVLEDCDFDAHFGSPEFDVDAPGSEAGTEIDLDTETDSED